MVWKFLSFCLCSELTQTKKMVPLGITSSFDILSFFFDFS